MRRTKLTLVQQKIWLESFLLLSFVFTTLLAQENNIKEIEETTRVSNRIENRNSTNNIGNIDGVQALNDKILIKNQSDIDILQIAEETNSAASILFYDKNDFTSPGIKLFRDGDDLYWGNSPLGITGSAGGWTDDGSVVRLSTIGDRVGIGTATPSSKLSVGGNGSSLYSIFGSNSASGGVGIYGSGSGSAGKGVQGFSSAVDGRGVVGYTTGYSGRAVYGESSTTSQFDKNYGGYFKATGEYAIGIYAEAIGTHGIGIIGFANDPQSFAGEFTNNGENSTAVSIINNGPNGKALYAVGSTAAIFGGKVEISGELVTDGEVTVGISGTPFLEIKEITGTNGNGILPLLPVGWTGAKTRLLSLEMKHGTSDEWVSLGYYIDDCSGAIFTPGHGERAVSLVFTEPNGRGLKIFYPLCGDIFDNSPWRAVIMRMP